MTARFLISHAEPILRARVIETLSTRFHSRVELAGLYVRYERGLQVSGEGLRVYRSAGAGPDAGASPLIEVQSFYFRAGLLRLLQSPMHVHEVYVEGLQINIPPKGERRQVPDLRQAGKIKIAIDELACADTRLLIHSSKPGKLPLEFDISRLTLRKIRPNEPWQFVATLVNPKPVGDIQSSGNFGPWQAEAPGDTPVSGSYSFSNADLSTIKGIGGILSSTGKYSGSLDRIVVDGRTDTPDFRVNVSGHPVPLHTDFHAIVDGTSGDTFLEPVKAHLLNSSFVAQGYVARVPGGKGREVKLDVAIDDARMEDLLKLAVRTDPPLMTATARMKINFRLPPGEADVVKRLLLGGSFYIRDAYFTSEKIQKKIDALSLRTQGKPQLANTGERAYVPSVIDGEFTLENGLLSFPRLQFAVPGTLVKLAGDYSLDGNRFEFHGKARLQARLSQMTTGWKSLMLKPVDPLFKKHGAGAQIPIRITGTRSEPHFGLDLGQN